MAHKRLRRLKMQLPQKMCLVFNLLTNATYDEQREKWVPGGIQKLLIRIGRKTLERPNKAWHAFVRANKNDEQASHKIPNN